MNESRVIGTTQSTMFIPPGITVHVVMDFREDGTVTWRYMRSSDKEMVENV